MIFLSVVFFTFLYMNNAIIGLLSLIIIYPFNLTLFKVLEMKKINKILIYILLDI